MSQHYGESSRCEECNGFPHPRATCEEQEAEMSLLYAEQKRIDDERSEDLMRQMSHPELGGPSFMVRSLVDIDARNHGTPCIFDCDEDVQCQPYRQEPTRFARRCSVCKAIYWQRKRVATPRS